MHTYVCTHTQQRARERERKSERANEASEHCSQIEKWVQCSLCGNVIIKRILCVGGGGCSHSAFYSNSQTKTDSKQNDVRINFANCGYVWINRIPIDASVYARVRVCVSVHTIWMGCWCFLSRGAQRSFDKWITFWFFMKKICVRIKLTKVSLNGARQKVHTERAIKRNKNENKKNRESKDEAKMKAWRVRWKSLWFKCRVERKR